MSDLSAIILKDLKNKQSKNKECDINLTLEHEEYKKLASALITGVATNSVINNK